MLGTRENCAQEVQHKDKQTEKEKKKIPILGQNYPKLRISIII